MAGPLSGPHVGYLEPMDIDPFAIAIGRLRERTRAIFPGDGDALITAIADFCREVHGLGQAAEVIHAIVDLHLDGRKASPVTRERARALVDECVADAG